MLEVTLRDEVFFCAVTVSEEGGRKGGCYGERARLRLQRLGTTKPRSLTLGLAKCAEQASTIWLDVVRRGEQMGEEENAV